jgi:hypothetical protein
MHQEQYYHFLKSVTPCATVDYSLLELAHNPTEYHTSAGYTTSPSASNAITTPTPIQLEHIPPQPLVESSSQTFQVQSQPRASLYTRTKHMNDRNFTELISNLTVLYWSTTITPSTDQQQLQQTHTIARLKQLNKEFKDTIQTNTIDCNPIHDFAQHYKLMSQHISPYLMQTFLAAETMKSAQNTKSTKRKRYSQKRHNIGPNDTDSN